ncbi:hypothetical protein PF003_g18750 [Phytophthora fragariae]|nr:hypothetical protein PF003_g18750 [Phytophthora fragariae]
MSQIASALLREILRGHGFYAPSSRALSREANTRSPGERGAARRQTRRDRRRGDPWEPVTSEWVCRDATLALSV